MVKSKTPGRGQRVARAGKNSRTSEKMQIGLRRRVVNRTTAIVGCGFLLILGIVLVGVFLFYRVYADPQHVFWGMINNNLSTPSVSKQSVRQNSTGQVNVESLQIGFVPNLRVHGVSSVYSGNRLQLQLSTIGLAASDYQSYDYIAPNISGKAVNYSKLYGKWLKSNNAQLIDQTVFGFGSPFFGDFGPATRAKMVSQIKNAYTIDFSEVTPQSHGSRRQYTYDVNISLRKYAQLARYYANTLNLPVAKQIKPTAYPQSSQFTLKLTVDVLSRQLVSVEYPQQSTKETYSGYGIVPDIHAPATIVSKDQFQKAINSAQH